MLQMGGGRRGSRATLRVLRVADQGRRQNKSVERERERGKKSLMKIEIGKNKRKKKKV